MSTAKDFYAKRLKKVLFEQFKKKMISKSEGVEPPLPKFRGGCDPPLFGARGAQQEEGGIIFFV